MNRLTKPIMLVLLTLLFSNALLWLQKAMILNPNPYTNGYTISYTTLIVAYGFAIEWIGNERKYIRVRKGLLGLSLGMLVFNYVPLLTLHSTIWVPVISIFTEPMTFPAGRVIVGIGTGMVASRSLLSSSPRSA
ncbi:MAG: hypothetical protein K0Q94_5099 [Paenibacillus sp.]|nr:hypothetical protein [Paenibacillus sp.]